VLYPPSFGSSAGVQGPELMMMSAMMAAGRMRRTRGEGKGRNTGLEAPSPALQQLSATSKRLHDGSLAARFLFCPLLNESDAILARWP